MKKYKIMMITALVLICSLAVLIGCSMTDALIPDDYEAAGYRRVYLYYNGGAESGSLFIEYFVRVAKPSEPDVVVGGRMPEPSNDGEVKIPVRSGYQFAGWYEINAEKWLKTREELLYNGNGDPLLNSRGKHASRTVMYVEGHDFLDADSGEEALTYRDVMAENAAGYPAGDKIFTTGREWNFAYDLIKEDTCLIALWSPVRKFAVVPIENKNDDLDAPGYDKLPLYDIDKTGSIQLSLNMYHPKKDGWQIEGFYSNRELTRKIPTDISYTPAVEYIDEDQTVYKVAPVYVKWLEAKYKIVDSASSMTTIGTNDNFYLRSNIDFGGKSISMPDEYRGIIKGNGFTWSNINMSIVQTNDPKADNTYGGLFKALRGARISDVNIENLVINFVRIDPYEVTDPTFWDRDIQINLFAKSIDESSKISNVTIGSVTEKSTFSDIDYSDSKITQRRVPLLDERGDLILQDTYSREVRKEETPKGSGIWEYPAEGSIRYNSLGNPYVLKYKLDYKGNRMPADKYAVDSEDGKILYGFQRYKAEGAKDVKWEQDGKNFGIADDKNSGQVVDCYVHMEEVVTGFDWEFIYDGSVMPKTPTPVSGYGFVGWYTSDLELYNFDTPLAADETVYLLAVWKEQAKQN